MNSVLIVFDHTSYVTA